MTENRTFTRDTVSLEQQSDLSNLIYRTRLHECSDPRDKIYSLLSVAKPASSLDEQIQPDYSRSVVQVYQDFTRSRIRANRDLRILSLVKQARETSTQLIPGSQET